VIRGCGFKVQGITKNMSNTKIIQKLQQIMSEYENEGMKERMTIKEIKKFKAIRASDKELADLQLAKKNISQGKRKPRRAALSKKVNYNPKFPKTGDSEVDEFMTASSVSEDGEHSSDFSASQ